MVDIGMDSYYYHKTQIIITLLKTYMHNQQEAIQAKQSYLRNNIIDKGYDPQQFMSFCAERYGEIDLEVWTIHKLTEVVNHYLSSINPSNHQQQEQWNQYEGDVESNIKNCQLNCHKTQISIHDIHQNHNIMFSDADWDFFAKSTCNTQRGVDKPTKHNHTKQTQNNTIPQLTFASLPTIPLATNNQTSSLKCQPSIEQLAIIDKKLIPDANVKPQEGKQKCFKMQTAKAKYNQSLPISQVAILHTQQVSRNFLQSDYTLYHILFKPCNHLIKRKFNDFRRLRNILQKLYPHILLPYIEPQGWLVNSSQGRDQQMLSKYKWMIVEFLKYTLISNEQLKNSSVVRDFTGFTKMDKSKQKDILKKIMDDYNQLPKPKLIKDLTLASNTLLFPYNPSYRKYISSHLSIMPQIDILYDKLKKQLQGLFYNYDILLKSLREVTTTFENLQTMIKKSTHNDISQKSKVYQGFRQMCLKIQNSVNDQNTMFKNRILNLVRYEKENMWCIKEVVDHSNRVAAEYSRYGSPQPSVIKSKTQIVDVDSPIPLEEISKNKDILPIQFSFWQHIANTQINRYWSGLTNRLNQQLTLIAYQNLNQENQNLNFWNKIIKKCI